MNQHLLILHNALATEHGLLVLSSAPRADRTAFLRAQALDPSLASLTITIRGDKIWIRKDAQAVR